MNAQAHLISLGWAGPGHALDSRPQYKQKGHRGLAYNPALDPLKVGNTGAGLVKPLSISRRKDRFGIGKKSHEPSQGTEWWLKGFETALGNIGKPESERSGTSTPTIGGTGKHNGLYGFFVRGQIMEGTISENMLKAGNVSSKKRKSDALEEDEEDETRANGRGFKKSKVSNGLALSPVRRKPETALDFATVGAFMKERDKERKRKAKGETMDDAEQFARIGQFFAASEQSDKAKKTKSSVGNGVSGIPDDVAHSAERTMETKEARRERRQKRKETRQFKHELSGKLLERSKPPLTDADNESEDEVAKAARKAEKKRRKAEKEARKLQRS